MKTKLIILFIITTVFSLTAQTGEEDLWWQKDGSLRVEGEHTFISPIVEGKESIKDTEMLLLNPNVYKGEEQLVHYGIYSEAIKSENSYNSELRIYRRSNKRKIIPPFYGFDLYDDDFLIYGCKNQAKPELVNHQTPWDAAGYYAHGYSFSETKIKSTDYKVLYNRPKSSTWWDTAFDAAIGTVVVAVISIAAVATSGASGAAMGALFSMAARVVTVGGVAALGLYTQTSTKFDTQNLSQLIYKTDMPVKVPKKKIHVSTDDIKKTDFINNWNKTIKGLLFNSFECPDDKNEKCYTLPIIPVVAQMKVKNTHVKHVNIPGELYKHLTPYQVFKNSQYIHDNNISINVKVTDELTEILPTADKFTNKKQILPRHFMKSGIEGNINFTINNTDANIHKYYYLLSKSKPDDHSKHYRDLGIYGTFNGSVYKLYRFLTATTASITLKTTPEGPFLAGDNIVMKKAPNSLSVRVYRWNGSEDHLVQTSKYKVGEEMNKIPQLNLKIGDSVVFGTFYKTSKIKGIPEIWIARAAGESKYFTTPSIHPNEYKPFLGYDSQVHGVAVRSHPTPNNKKTPRKLYNKDTQLYEWYWIAQRRMESQIKSSIENRTSENAVLKKYKEAKRMGQDKFAIGNKDSITKQRNNQREGYNMQFLYAWKKKNENLPSFNNYDGSKFILGLDTDEIVYINNKDKDKTFLQLKKEVWKTLPEGDEDDPINKMVSAYISNRNYLDGNTHEQKDYKGYEILDKAMYREIKITELGNNLAPCNGKPCVKFYKNGNHKPDPNIKAPGNFEMVTANKTDIKILVDITSPQETDYGFYGSIKGDQYPSEWQKQVPYTFRGLTGLKKEVLETLVMEYTHENELGILKKYTKYYKEGDGTLTNDEWTVPFDIQGWGYNEITVYVQRKPGATMVPIAGMELLEIMLRFVSAPGAKYKDFSPEKFKGLDLNEGKGDGNYWYLRDSNKEIAKYSSGSGKSSDAINKSYTLSKGDKIAFTAMDSDPHTFFHYQDEFYLSERFMAKRLSNVDLEQRIQWFLASADNKELGDYIGKGRNLNHPFYTPGKYRLTAVYGSGFSKETDDHSNTRMSVEITVMPTKYDKKKNTDKGVINISSLNKAQIELINSINTTKIDDSWKVAEVTNIFSKWTYVDGPRASPASTKPNRFGRENDYNSEFLWTGRYLNISSKIKSKDPSLAWLPNNYIRHYSEKALPNDITENKLFHDDEEQFDQALSTAFPEQPLEPWQWRLPWISKTKWQGYVTRANIKAVYNMTALFDNQKGAFAGVGLTTHTKKDYATEASKVIPKLTDKEKSKYDFYLDLISQRKIIFNPDSTSIEQLGVNQRTGRETKVVIVKPISAAHRSTFLQGADMSMVKNLENEEIKWNFDGNSIDPYQILSGAGANVARFRLWVAPVYDKNSTKKRQKYPYSNLQSVKNEIKRAKKKRLQVILDLHFSDTWADPKQQIMPKEWSTPVKKGTQQQYIENYILLGKEQQKEITDLLSANDMNLIPSTSSAPVDWALLYLLHKTKTYIKDVLKTLNEADALPDIIQVGNEINGNLMMTKPYEELEIGQIADEIGVLLTEMNRSKHTINWNRNASIINTGLKTVKAFNTSIKTMLHIAGPSTAVWWLDQALNKNAPYRLGKQLVEKKYVDIIGLSYYNGEDGQQQTLPELKNIINHIGNTYEKEVLIVETAFPQTYEYSDKRVNAYSKDVKHRGSWPAEVSAKKQLEWLTNLKYTLLTTKHSIGFVYWEPFWIGSEIVSSKDATGSNWENMNFFKNVKGNPLKSNELDSAGGIMVFSAGGNLNNPKLNIIETTSFGGGHVGPPLIYYVGRSSSGSRSNNSKTVQSTSNLRIKPSLSAEELPNNLDNQFEVFPNPTSDELVVSFTDGSTKFTVLLLDLQGKVIYVKEVKNSSKHSMSTKNLQINAGIYILQVISEKGTGTKKIILE
jgi:arabinogalactan endo-1,4-beta-galactosidase